MIKNRLHLKALKTFEVVARLRSLTKAADELHITQSAVSKQLSMLESLIGEKLFVRKTHGIMLTPIGQSLFTPVQQAFDIIDAAAWKIESNKTVKRIRINAPATCSRRWLAPKLHLLQDSFPNTQIHLHTLPDDAGNRDLEDSDFSIRFGKKPWPGLSCHMLFKERHIAVCAPQLLDVNHKEMLDISKKKLIHTVGCEMDWSNWLEEMKIEGVNTNQGIFFDVQDMAIKTAINAHGVALVDAHMVQHEVSEGFLVQWTSHSRIASTGYWLVCKPITLEVGGMQHVHDWLLKQI